MSVIQSLTASMFTSINILILNKVIQKTLMLEKALKDEYLRQTPVYNIIVANRAGPRVVGMARVLMRDMSRVSREELYKEI